MIGFIPSILLLVFHMSHISFFKPVLILLPAVINVFHQIWNDLAIIISNNLMPLHLLFPRLLLLLH